MQILDYFQFNFLQGFEAILGTIFHLVFEPPPKPWHSKAMVKQFFFGSETYSLYWILVEAIYQIDEIQLEFHVWCVVIL